MRTVGVGINIIALGCALILQVSKRDIFARVCFSGPLLRKFCLLCDTIDDNGVSTQRHHDEDTCAK